MAASVEAGAAVAAASGPAFDPRRSAALAAASGDGAAGGACPERSSSAAAREHLGAGSAFESAPVPESGLADRCSPRQRGAFRRAQKSL